MAVTRTGKQEKVVKASAPVESAKSTKPRYIIAYTAATVEDLSKGCIYNFGYVVGNVFSNEKDAIERILEYSSNEELEDEWNYMVLEIKSVSAPRKIVMEQY